MTSWWRRWCALILTTTTVGWHIHTVTHTDTHALPYTHTCRAYLVPLVCMGRHLKSTLRIKLPLTDTQINLQMNTFQHRHKACSIQQLALSVALCVSVCVSVSVRVCVCVISVSTGRFLCAPLTKSANWLHLGDSFFFYYFPSSCSSSASTSTTSSAPTSPSTTSFSASCLLAYY